MFYVLKKCVLFPTLCTCVLISSILPYSSCLVYDFGNGNAYTLINLGFLKHTDNIPPSKNLCYLKFCKVHHEYNNLSKNNCVHSKHFVTPVLHVL